jgi:hypothetical protein
MNALPVGEKRFDPQSCAEGMHGFSVIAEFPVPPGAAKKTGSREAP